MAWPSGTKAGTTNVDAGSDKPALARPDIKQNIDNVNSIIDTFDIAAPNNGDILTYNSTSGAWEPGAAATSGIDLGVINIATGEQNVSGTIYRRTVEEKFDSGSFIALSGSYQFTLTAGTYYAEPQTVLTSQTTGAEVSIELYNETDASSVVDFTWDQVATTTEYLLRGAKAFTVVSTKTFSLRQTTGTAADRNVNGIRIKFYKY